MSHASNLDDALLRRRKTMVWGMIFLTVVVLFSFTFAAWRYLQKMGDYLEEELARRLISVATLTADVIEKDGKLTYAIESDRLPLVIPSLNEILTKIDFENQLQGVYLVDRSLKVISSSGELLQFGDKIAFLDSDSLAINQADAGAPSVANTHVIAGSRFKSAYAPVSGPLGDVMAIVVVQANADFFNLMRDLRQGMILGGGVALTLIAFFSTFLVWAIRRLINAHESLRRTERLAAMGQMAATVAHEIRNPLSIIKGTADVLQTKYDSQAEPDELFEFIPSEVRRLNRLVSDFLTFARDRDVEHNATDLTSSVEKSLGSLEEEIEHAGITLVKEFDDLPQVPHDEDSINQLMLNFVLNSVQSINGSGVITVRLKANHLKSMRVASVEIQDNGKGFDQASEKIFEPFYTTKTSGSGLGLAICKRIIEKHNGWIEVESEKGKGTRMRFYLPAN